MIAGKYVAVTGALAVVIQSSIAAAQKCGPMLEVPICSTDLQTGVVTINIDVELDNDNTSDDATQEAVLLGKAVLASYLQYGHCTIRTCDMTNSYGAWISCRVRRKMPMIATALQKVSWTKTCSDMDSVKIRVEAPALPPPKAIQ